MPGDVNAKISKIECSNGEIFDTVLYDITPFGASSFMVQQLNQHKRFIIIPTRYVARIYMEVADAEAVDQSKT